MAATLQCAAKAQGPTAASLEPKWAVKLAANQRKARMPGRARLAKASRSAKIRRLLLRNPQAKQADARTSSTRLANSAYS